MRIRTLLVDDEPLARRRLRDLLEGDPEIDLIGECGDGAAAVVAIDDLRPDLVFLDVQMPALDGFGVLQALDSAKLPAVVFVTAHDKYAVKAFEVHAMDYLLKPYDRRRFCAALDRAKDQLRRGDAADVERRVLALLQARPASAERLIVKSAGRVAFVRLEDIDWIEAAGNYVRLHVGAGDHLLRETLSSLETRLDPKRFVRIHRSTIVSVDRIREIQPAFHGDQIVILRDGQELCMSRGYRDKVSGLLQ